MDDRIVPYGPNGRFEVQAEGRRVAVFDCLEDAYLFLAAPALLEACELISNLANPGKTMTDEEWLAVIGPIMEQQERPDETNAVFEAIYRIANAALAAWRGETGEPGKGEE